jgi:uroporphyrinogen-III synthase
MHDHRIRILSTRPLDQSIHEIAAQNGITIDTISFIRTEPITSKTLSLFIKGLREHQHYIVFTSKNAVQIVVNELNGIKPPWKIFCIDAATKELVGNHFGTDAIIATAPYGAQLAEEILKYKIEELIFFCGNQRREELPTILKEAGIKLKELVVYNTIATPQKIDENYDAIAFFSPSAVNSFFEANENNINATLFAIGRTTENAIKEHTKKEVFLPDRPGTDQLIETIIEHYKTSENKQSS